MSPENVIDGLVTLAVVSVTPCPVPLEPRVIVPEKVAASLVVAVLLVMVEVPLFPACTIMLRPTEMATVLLVASVVLLEPATSPRRTALLELPRAPAAPPVAFTPRTKEPPVMDVVPV